MTARKRASAVLALFAISIAAGPMLHAADKAKSKPEEIEWTWEVRPTQVDPRLPNVLLEGDSITRNLFPEVQKRLAGKANVYLMASSISVGDPRLPLEIREFAKMEGVPFRVVHFNNGMHGWVYSEAEYKAAFPSYMRALHSIAPRATFIWSSTTPVRKDKQPGPTNARVDARNAIAATFTKGLLFDDQNTLMQKYGNERLDDVHFNPKGSAAGGDQAAALIEKALSAKQ